MFQGIAPQELRRLVFGPVHADLNDCQWALASLRWRHLSQAWPGASMVVALLWCRGRLPVVNQSIAWGGAYVFSHHDASHTRKPEKREPLRCGSSDDR